MKQLYRDDMRMEHNIISLFEDSDPRIASLVDDIKKVIYDRSIGVFQLATVLGALRVVEHELIKETEDNV